MTKKAREKNSHTTQHTPNHEKKYQGTTGQSKRILQPYIFETAPLRKPSPWFMKKVGHEPCGKNKNHHIYIYVCVCINILFKYVSICIYVSILSTLHHDFERKYFQANRTFAWKLLHRFLLLWGARTSTFFFWNQSNMTYCFKSHRLRLNQQK